MKLPDNQCANIIRDNRCKNLYQEIKLIGQDCKINSIINIFKLDMWNVACSKEE